MQMLALFPDYLTEIRSCHDKGQDTLVFTSLPDL